MRVLLLPLGILVSLLGAIAVSSSGCGGVALPAGAITGSVAGAPASTCSADGTYYVVLAMDDCGFLNCPGKLAYALCDGTSYSACTCTEPAAGSGWTKNGSVDLGPPDAGNMFPDVGVPPPVDHFVPPHDSTVTDAEDGGVFESGPVDTGPGDAGPG